MAGLGSDLSQRSRTDSRAKIFVVEVGGVGRSVGGSSRSAPPVHPVPLACDL